jgi:hypothetical protein
MKYFAIAGPIYLNNLHPLYKGNPCFPGLAKRICNLQKMEVRLHNMLF